jgi:hypothetical protein
MRLTLCFERNAGVMASADDHVIDERNARNARGVRHVGCKSDVFHAWGRIPARMVVHEHESRGIESERDANRIGRADGGALQTAFGNASRRAKLTSCIEREKPKLLMGEGGKARDGP